MFPEQLRRRSRTTLRPARLRYLPFDEASLFNPFRPASRRFSVGKRAGGTDGVKTILGSPTRSHYSAFMFAPLAIFANVATSSRISLSHPSGVVGCGCRPIGIQRCLTSGWERMRTISRLSFVTIGFGTVDEVSSPNQSIDS